MGRDDWYRSREWTPAIEDAFNAKLGRARDQRQYLLIQADHIAETSPLAALVLLERYFELDDESFLAPAFLVQAHAQLALGDLDAALESYDSALAQESKRPSTRTVAALEYPLLVAQQRLVHRYDHALSVLSEKSDAFLPLHHFQRAAAIALISMDLGDKVSATRFACLALEQANRESSGLQRHATIGLVGDGFEALRIRLLEITKA